MLKLLKVKTIITTCLALASGSVCALQVMDDDSMSRATGQDGLTIKLENFAPNARVIWTDTNGINPADGINPLDYGLTGSPEAGAVAFGDGTTAGNFRVSNGTTVITVDADAGAGGVLPVMNVNIDLPDDLSIQTGDIYVAAKDTNNNLINQTKIMHDMKIELGGLGLNIQLGNTPQDGFIRVYGVLPNGLRVSNIGLVGATSGADEYGIGIQEMLVRDVGQSSQLTFNGARIDVTNQGLLVSPSANKQVDVLMHDFKLGNLAGANTGIGDVGLLGLKLGGMSLMISGH